MPLDVDRLRRESLYDVEATVAGVDNDLAQLETLDGQWRESRRKYRITLVVGFVLGIAGLAVFLPAGVIVLIVVGILLFRKPFPKAVLNNSWRGDFARSLTGMLARDAQSEAKTHLRVAFNPAEEQLSETPMPHRKKGVERLLKASWLSMDITLLDGTGITVTTDDLIRRRSFVNARGKSKSKTRVQHLLGMRFAYAADTYGDVSPLAGRLQKEIHLPESAAVRGAEITPRAIKVKAVVADSGELSQTCATLALGVYRMLNLSRRLEAHRRANPQPGGEK
jgi:hypothetical protein